MPIRLFRWALPHKGPPTHLTRLEYALRFAVFTPLWLVTFAPMIMFVLFCAFGGPFALLIVFGFSGISTGADFGWTSDEKSEFLFYAVCLFVVAAINIFIRHRLLTPR